MKQSQISAHQQAYDAVLNNPYWYGDQPNLLKEAFNAKNTRRRAEITVDILRRAAKRKSERHLSEQYFRLADKLSNCRKSPLWLLSVPQVPTGIPASEDDGPSQIDSSNRRTISQRDLVHGHDYSEGVELSSGELGWNLMPRNSIAI